MKKITIVVAALMIVFASSCTPGKSTSKGKDKSLYSKQIVFDEKTKFNNILTQAQAEGKPIFIDFYTDWCAPCKWLEQDVFNTEYAAQYFNKNMVNFKVNAEKGQGIDLAAKYKVKAYPTIIYLDPYGKELKRHVGMTTVTKVVDMAKQAVEQTEEMNKRLGK